MAHTTFLTAEEFRALHEYTNSRSEEGADLDRIYVEIDQLLADAFRRNLGLERYMVVRLTESGVCREMQVQRFEGFACKDVAFIGVAGPKLTPKGEIGRKLYHYEMLGDVAVERRLLDGTWRPLGVFRR